MANSESRFHFAKFPLLFPNCAGKTSEFPQFSPNCANFAKMAVFANPGFWGLAPQLRMKSAENFPTGAIPDVAQLGKTAEKRPIAQTRDKNRAPLQTAILADVLGDCHFGSACSNASRRFPVRVR